MEVLLSPTEPKLLAHLKKVLLPISKSKKPGTRDTDDEFHNQLLSLVHPFVKKLFVGQQKCKINSITYLNNFLIYLSDIGALSMEVICFILDQCLIFTELRKTKFMPYCLATWMILLKKRIMSCREVSIRCKSELVYVQVTLITFTTLLV